MWVGLFSRESAASPKGDPARVRERRIGVYGMRSSHRAAALGAVDGHALRHFADGATGRHRGLPVGCVSLLSVADSRPLRHQRRLVVVEDVKGVRTPVYRLKRRLFVQRNPGIDFGELR